MISVKPFLTPLVITVSAILFASVLIAGASLDDVKYPVKELGNCKNEEDCLRYCEDRNGLERVKSCISFAKRYELLSPAELKEAEYYVFTLGVTKGPGECRNQKECDLYCENTTHFNECLDFAEKYALSSPEEIVEGRKIAKALGEGADLPGGCKTKSECESYCEDPPHMRVCVDFAKKAGFISEDEAREAEKIIPLLESGEKTPGNCGRKNACEAYCMEPSHIDECLAFAEKAGLIPPEELADAKRFAPYIKSGETPGGCKRKEECEVYCGDPAHLEECVSFAEKIGMMSKEDAELARKVKGAGPGGCKSKQECEEFCKNPPNQETCINFAKEHGLVEEVAEIEAKVSGEMESKMKTCAEKPCSEFIACLHGLQGERARGDEGAEEKNLPADLQGKLTACIKEIETQAIKNAVLQGTPVAPGEQTPSGVLVPPPEIPKEGEKQYQEEYQKQYEERKKEEEAKVIQQFCPQFTQAPSCAYFGEGTQNYQYCKQCFPNK